MLLKAQISSFVVSGADRLENCSAQWSEIQSCNQKMFSITFYGTFCDNNCFGRHCITRFFCKVQKGHVSMILKPVNLWLHFLCVSKSPAYRYWIPPLGDISGVLAIVWGNNRDKTLPFCTGWESTDPGCWSSGLKRKNEKFIVQTLVAKRKYPSLIIFAELPGQYLLRVGLHHWQICECQSGAFANKFAAPANASRRPRLCH